MFIVNGKSRCCNDIFTDVRFTSLLSEIFIHIGYFFKENKNACFFLNKVYCRDCRLRTASGSISILFNSFSVDLQCWISSPRL